MGWSGESLARSKSRSGHRIATELGITAGEGDLTAPTNPRVHPKTKVQAPTHKTQKNEGKPGKGGEDHRNQKGGRDPQEVKHQDNYPHPRDGRDGYLRLEGR